MQEIVYICRPKQSFRAYFKLIKFNSHTKFFIPIGIATNLKFQKKSRFSNFLWKSDKSIWVYEHNQQFEHAGVLIIS